MRQNSPLPTENSERLKNTAQFEKNNNKFTLVSCPTFSKIKVKTNYSHARETQKTTNKTLGTEGKSPQKNQKKNMRLLYF